MCEEKINKKINYYILLYIIIIIIISIIIISIIYYFFIILLLLFMVWYYYYHHNSRLQCIIYNIIPSATVTQKVTLYCSSRTKDTISSILHRFFLFTSYKSHYFRLPHQQSQQQQKSQKKSVDFKLHNEVYNYHHHHRFFF